MSDEELSGKVTAFRRLIRSDETGNVIAEAEANCEEGALRIEKCWNMHNELLAVLEEIVAGCERCDLMRFRGLPHCSQCKKLKALIEKARAS